MADRGRPILPRRSDIRAALPEAVQPPDDRTYSAEVTAFRRNLPHHRSVRIVSLHALDNDTTLFPICQAEFQKKAQSFSFNFSHYGNGKISAKGRRQ